jgi:hypothetical protein
LKDANSNESRPRSVGGFFSDVLNMYLRLPSAVATRSEVPPAGFSVAHALARATASSLMGIKPHTLTPIAKSRRRAKNRPQQFHSLNIRRFGQRISHSVLRYSTSDRRSSSVNSGPMIPDGSFLTSVSSSSNECPRLLFQSSDTSKSVSICSTKACRSRLPLRLRQITPTRLRSRPKIGAAMLLADDPPRNVMLFSGHMIHAPERRTPRFPQDLVELGRRIESVAKHQDLSEVVSRVYGMLRR